MAPVVVVIDDEPVIGAGIQAGLRTEAAADLDVRYVDRPRRLRQLAVLPHVTHAVVDLSYGRDDLDGPALRPELETGSDAIAYLRAQCPSCEIVVATRNDTELATEMAVAVRQTWPEIRFLHKADEGLTERVEAFVLGRAVRDNAEIALDLAGVDPVPLERLKLVVSATARPRPVARLLMTLADQPVSIGRREVAARLGMSDNYVRALAHDVAVELLDRRLLRGERGGIGSLWRWSRARRGMLRRALVPSLLMAEPTAEFVGL
ncbi:MAG: hypothetical protein AAF962_14095 [Actinomycetota bacterium]